MMENMIFLSLFHIERLGEIYLGFKYKIPVKIQGCTTIPTNSETVVVVSR